MKPTEVASSVYRLGTDWTNFYLVRDGPEYALVDTGFPDYFEHFERGLAALGAALAAVEGVVLTHHHIDHAGAAQRLRLSCGGRVIVHAGDAAAVRGKRRSYVPPGVVRHCWRPHMIRFLAHGLAAGGARYWPVEAAEQIVDEDQRLDLPGRPRPIHMPGHTPGHSSVALEERGVVFCGDALVNLDCATGQRGVRLHRFNEDPATALASLDRLETIDGDTILFGHGDPWTGPLRRALAQARERSGFKPSRRATAKADRCVT